MNNSHNLSLQLIELFVALCESGTTTRTGQILCLSQSAVSHGLRRLRDQFDDPLFVRHGNKMEMTSKAATLYPQFKQWLEHFEHIIAPESFIPSSSRATLSLGCSDLIEQMYGPHILNQIASIAPFIKVNIIKLDANSIAEGLIRETFDVAIGVRQIDDSRIMSEVLYSEKFSSCVDAGHPILSSDNNLDAFLDYPHILASLHDGQRSVIDKALDKIGRQRDLQHTVFSFSNVPYFIAGSQFIWTAPSRYVAFCCKLHALASFDTPLDLPTNTLKLYWAKRQNNDPAQQWFRQVIIEVIKGQAH